uniref:Uncharacterized protein n=1 Tax=Arundo donax TaxID=35708 RepID=A0A0A8XND2_ARUDO
MSSEFMYISPSSSHLGISAATLSTTTTATDPPTRVFTMLKEFSAESG